MTDERLRALERRWRETGAVADEAALLQERLRAGELDRDALELAAYLDHPAARAVLGDAAPASMRATSAYDAHRPEPRLVVGLADDPRTMLAALSTGYLAAAWARCQAALARAGLDRVSMAYGGCSSELSPEPSLVPSPFAGFGWVADADLDEDGLRRLGAALETGTGPRLFAAVGWRRVFRSVEPPGRAAGLFALFEWALNDPAEWAELLPERLPASALGRVMLDLVGPRARPESMSQPSPFAPDAPRPLRDLLMPRLLRGAERV